MNHVPRHHDVSLGYFTYEDCQQMNVAFAMAMLAARRRGDEIFTIGPLVDHSHIEYAPRRFVGEYIWSATGSSAGMCADMGNQEVSFGPNAEASAR